MNTTTLSAITEALGWTLLHFLWQGTAITLGVVLLSALFKRWRYTIATVAMFTMLACAITTFLIEFESPAPTPVAVQSDSPATLNQPVKAPFLIDETTAPMALTGESPVPRATAAKAAWLPWLVTGWAIGVGLLSLRLLLNWRSVRRLRRLATPITDHPISAQFSRLVAYLKITAPVRLLSSAKAKVPMVIGAFKPAIILPARLLSGFDEQQLEAIIAHELAHVRRHDYLVNLLQNLLEALFFYHPAVWWVSAQMRQQRENCSDDIAAMLTGGPLVYGRALAALEHELGGIAPIAGVAASGGSLVQRIRRLAGMPDPQRSAWPAVLVCSATAVVAALSLLMSANAEDDPTEPEKDDDGIPKTLPVAELPDELSRALSWGKKNKSGLAAAISLDPRQDSYTVGAKLEREFLIANFGSKTTKFTVGHWLQDDNVNMKALDWSGEKLDLGTINDSGVTLLIDVTLDPGQFVSVPSSPVFLKPIPKGEGVSPSGAYIGAIAGQNVKLLATVELEDLGKLPTGATEFKVIKPTPIKIVGKVVDDATGEPVTNFIIQAGLLDKDKPGGVTWGFSETRGSGREGKFSTQLRWHEGWTARIVADGYEPQPILMKLPKDAGEKIELTLRLMAGGTIHGRVLDHNGKPLAGAAVFRIGPTGLRLGAGKAWQSWGDEVDTSAKPATTGADGKFELSAGGSDRIAVSDATIDAWPVAIPEDAEKEMVIRLPEPASLTIKYDIDGGYEEDELFFQSLLHGDPLWKGLEVVGNLKIKNGSEITVKALTPGPYQFARSKTIRMKTIGMGLFRDRTFLELKPGDKRTLSFVRENGVRVKGTIQLPEGVDVTGTIIKIQSLEKIKDPIDGNDYITDYAGTAVKEDGTFETERVPPGKHKVIAECYVQEKADGNGRLSTGRMGPSYFAEVEIEVPEEGDAVTTPALVFKKK